MTKLHVLWTLTLCFLSTIVSAQFGPRAGWYHATPTEQVNGISTDASYDELLADRQSVPVVVAVIDSGVDAEHEDLRDIMWVNEDEVPDNGIDDDQNGYVDDIHGWNFIGGKDGRNVDIDTYEVTRLYAKLKYKYEGAVEGKLNKSQLKEYQLYQECKKVVEKKRESAQNNLGKIEKIEGQIAASLDAIEKAIGERPLTLANVDSIDADGDQHVFIGKQIVAGIFTEVGTFEDMEALRAFVADEFISDKEHYENQLQFAYSADFDPRDIVGDDYSDPNDRYYGNNDVEGPDAFHGTHVAGIIGAIRDNDLGMNGIADNVRIMSVRAVPDGDERDKDVANAIRYAVDNGASIINMSFGKGYSWDKQVVDDAVRYAEKNDVLLVHAAGNSSQNNDEANNFPNDHYEKPKGFLFFKKKRPNNWLEVGALSWEGEDGIAAPFSNYGKENVDVFAPGMAIYSTIPDGKYRNAQGTSMASPVVAGIASVLRSYFPTLSAKQVREIIIESAQKVDTDVRVPGTDEKKPFSELCAAGGVVNLYEAVSQAARTKGKKKLKKNKGKA